MNIFDHFKEDSPFSDFQTLPHNFFQKIREKKLCQKKASANVSKWNVFPLQFNQVYKIRGTAITITPRTAKKIKKE